MKLALALIATLFVSGCVMPGDLHQLKVAQLELKSGSISPDEFNDKIDDIVTEIEDRMDDIVDGSFSLGELALGGTGISGMAAMALNLWRNSTRKNFVPVSNFVPVPTGPSA